MPTTLPPYYYDRTTTSNWAILLYPEPTKSSVETSYEAPTMLPIPPEEDDNDTSNDPDSTYKNYDEKWNVEEEEPEEEPPKKDPHVEKEMPATMVLVIGIILGAFVAMVLIVIIGNFFQAGKKSQFVDSESI